jgi:mRNA-degrading endonuclease toxin of MazEF toxin-antitoxin module
MRDCQKYLKGQIWWVEREPGEVKGSVYDKSRPFIIVSNDDNNAGGDVMQMCPVTSKQHIASPKFVEFYMADYGHKSTIVCDQITSISKTQLGEYMGSVSMAVLREVERGIMATLDIRSSKATLKDIEILIDELFHKHQAQLEAEKLSLNADQIMDCITARLEQLTHLEEQPGEDPVEDPAEAPEEDRQKSACNAAKKEKTKLHIVTPEEPKEAPEEPEAPETTEAPEEPEEVREAPVITPKTSSGPNFKIEGIMDLPDNRHNKRDSKKDNTKDKKKEATSPKRIWTEELMLAFLVDCDSLQISEVMEKWGMPKPSVYTNKHVFGKRLKLNQNKV